MQRDLFADLNPLHTPYMGIGCARIGQVVVVDIENGQQPHIRVWVTSTEDCPSCGGWAHWVEDRKGGGALVCTKFLHILH